MNNMSFSDTSSLDFSLMDFDVEEGQEALIVKKKMKNKKKRPKKRRLRKRKGSTFFSDDLGETDLSGASSPFDISETDAPSRTAPESALSQTTSHSSALTFTRIPIPFPGGAPVSYPDSDFSESQVSQAGRGAPVGEEDDLILRVAKDYGPEPVGIVKLVMKRRREKKEEESRLPVPPPPPPPPPSAEETLIVSEEEESVYTEQTLKPEPQKYISCKFIKPGPGHYDHYSTVGYINHDPTKKRAPGFTFGRKQTIREKRCGPAPNKYNMRGFTNRGKDKPIAHEFGKRRPNPLVEPLPGPADYKDQTLYLAKRTRTAIMYGREEETKNLDLPIAFGEVPSMGYSRPVACLIGKPKAPKPNKFPSPLSYSPVKPDVYLTRSPSFSMGQKRPPLKKDSDYYPPVGTYNPNYEYLKKKFNIVIPSNNDSCVRIPLDLPEKRKKQ